MGSRVHILAWCFSCTCKCMINCLEAAVNIKKYKDWIWRTSNPKNKQLIVCKLVASVFKKLALCDTDTIVGKNSNILFRYYYYCSCTSINRIWLSWGDLTLDSEGEQEGLRKWEEDEWMDGALEEGEQGGHEGGRQCCFILTGSEWSPPQSNIHVWPWSFHLGSEREMEPRCWRRIYSEKQAVLG